MPYSLEQLADEIKSTLTADAGPSGRAKICDIVSEALGDTVFIDRYLQDRKPGDDPREVLYEDAEMGFCVCGHVYNGEAIGEPHDHGESWAVYGQATGETLMTEWKIVKSGDKGSPSLVEPVETYVMKPGDARLYDIGAIHSPHRAEPVKLLRIEGTNLDHIQRGNYKASG